MQPGTFAGEPAPPALPLPIGPPELRVAADVAAPADSRALASLHVRVSDARAPVRLRFHVDGVLLAVQCGTGLTFDVPAAVAPGVHTVTVWADDALGRRAQTSVRLPLPMSATAPAGVLASPRGAPRGLRRLLGRIWG